MSVILAWPNAAGVNTVCDAIPRCQAPATVPVVALGAVRPMVRIWWAWDLAPSTAAPWVDSRGTVNIPVGSAVAEAVGLSGSIFGVRPTKRRCKLANVPAVLRHLVDVAVEQDVTRPEDHPLRAQVLV
ncbi:hypothetical protein [Frankia tisae]|uniref:hypothetical protein n=1 Tax=Frankia tisae TaxID=2950104 RepID=UPI0021C18C2D|nr:hypothetical protein [Frankia tisae]